MKPQKIIVKTIFSLLVVFAILMPTASGWTTPEQFQAGGDLVLDSEKVCSPRTSNKCLPGPFQETVQVPDGVTGVNIDVYWIWTGSPDQIQTNEHSNFTATAGSDQLGQVYCQDFGNEAQTHSLCGSVSGSVSAGQTLTLEIVHADPNRGPSPGSHRQQWVIDWVEAPPTAVPPTSTTVVQPPVLTNTPTSLPPTEVPPTQVPPTSTTTSPPPTEVPPTEIPPTSTTVVQPPALTNTPTSLPPTQVPPTNTPTSTSVVQPPAPTDTPTSQPPTQAPPTQTPTEVPSEEEESPRPTRTPVPQVSGPSVTNTPRATLRATATTPAPTPTRTPQAVLPVTGGDSVGPDLVDFGWKAGLVMFGLLLAAFGLFREMRDVRR